MRRALLLIALLIVLGAATGCGQQREENNPFIGPSGQANEMPWGASIPTPAPAPKT